MKGFCNILRSSSRSVNLLLCILLLFVFNLEVVLGGSTCTFEDPSYCFNDPTWNQDYYTCGGVTTADFPELGVVANRYCKPLKSGTMPSDSPCRNIYNYDDGVGVCWPNGGAGQVNGMSWGQAMWNAQVSNSTYIYNQCKASKGTINFGFSGTGVPEPSEYAVAPTGGFACCDSWWNSQINLQWCHSLECWCPIPCATTTPVVTTTHFRTALSPYTQAANPANCFSDCTDCFNLLFGARSSETCLSGTVLTSDITGYEIGEVGSCACCSSFNGSAPYGTQLVLGTAAISHPSLGAGLPASPSPSPSQIVAASASRSTNPSQTPSTVASRSSLPSASPSGAASRSSFPSTSPSPAASITSAVSASPTPSRSTNPSQTPSTVASRSSLPSASPTSGASKTSAATASKNSIASASPTPPASRTTVASASSSSGASRSTVASASRSSYPSASPSTVASRTSAASATPSTGASRTSNPSASHSTFPSRSTVASVSRSSNPSASPSTGASRSSGASQSDSPDPSNSRVKSANPIFLSSLPSRTPSQSDAPSATPSFITESGSNSTNSTGSDDITIVRTVNTSSGGDQTGTLVAAVVASFVGAGCCLAIVVVIVVIIVVVVIKKKKTSAKMDQVMNSPGLMGMSPPPGSPFQL